MTNKQSKNMIIRAITFIALTFLFNACVDNSVEVNEPLNGKTLEQFVIDAVNGNKTAIDTLNGIFDGSLPPPPFYNKLSIDSVSFSTSRYYTVLIEFENPVYNVFAIYDSAFSMRLIDRSLNGHLSLSKKVNNENGFLEIHEEFISKNIFSIKRYNLYYFDKDTVTKSLRFCTELSDAKVKLTHSIIGFADDVINTKLVLSPKSTIKETWDTFLWLEGQLKFISQSNTFDSLIIPKIALYKPKVSANIINDKISALRSTGLQISADSINAYNNFTNATERFTIFLPEGWRSLKNVMITKELKKSMLGTHFISNTLGASFSVVKIGEMENAENYLSLPLSNEVKGNYSVRFSEKISTKKSYLQFFEVSCVNLKYIVIFECPIITYEAHKSIYEDIMNSFGVDC